MDSQLFNTNLGFISLGGICSLFSFCPASCRTFVRGAYRKTG